ncbi:MAG: hypothetical protein ACXAC7_08245 [Candidatus Hodarchaeales archaeon]
MFPHDEIINFSNPEQNIIELQKRKINGLLILQMSGIPLLIRDYNTQGFFRLDNAELLTGFISAINSYADSINSFLTDIGLGGTRLIIKKTSSFIYCLFIDEFLHQINQGKELLTLTEITLQKLIKTFEIYYSLVTEEEKRRRKTDKGLLNKRKIEQFKYQADLILLQSLIEAYKMTTLNQKI